MAPCVLWISSHVADGRVGNSIAVFALQRLGIDVIAVPSVLLPVVPAPGRPEGGPIPDELFRRVLEGLHNAGALKRVIAVHAGYLRTEDQVSAVADLFEAARRQKPETRLSLDPVLGDGGRLYIPEQTATAIRETLVPSADLLFPNAFELAFLSGIAPKDLSEAAAAARSLGPVETVCTSLTAKAPDKIVTMVVGPKNSIEVETPRVAHAPNGTGDLLSALYLGRRTLGADAATALAASTATVFDLIVQTQDAMADRLATFERQELLVSPKTKLTTTETEKPA